MISTNLYARLIILIIAVVIYLQYTHYILTIHNVLSAPTFKSGDRSIFKNFVELRDIYIPAARPFIRNISNVEVEIIEEIPNYIAELHQDKPSYLAEGLQPKFNVADKSKYIAELHQHSLTASEKPQKSRHEETLPVTPIPAEETLKLKPIQKKTTDPDVHWNPEANPDGKFKKLKETITKHAKPHEMIDSDTMKAQVSHSHQYSPREGSRIVGLSKKEMNDLLTCGDQPNCIIPALQLQRKVNIYLCEKPKDGGGVRFYFLIKQGLLHHPNVALQKTLNSSTISSIDYIFYLPGSSPWDKSECGASSDLSIKTTTHPTVVGPIVSKKKMIVLEEFDNLEPLFSPYGTFQEMKDLYGPTLVYYFTYFKRSFYDRNDGKFIDFPLINHKQQSQYPDIFPITYPIADDYISKSFNFHNHREIDILCTLRGSRNASSPMSTRIRVQEWTSEYVNTRKLTHAITEPLNMATRTALNKAYFEHMHNAKIIVTVNPAEWEGDFRTWESLAAGALVFVDPLMVPHPFPLLDGVHLVYFSSQNKSELWQKLDFYMNNPEERERVALGGYLHAMKHHRTTNLVDYMLRTSEVKRSVLSREPIPPYTFTGQYLNYEARQQEKRMARSQSPGHYKATIPRYKVGKK